MLRLKEDGGAAVTAPPKRVTGTRTGTKPFACPIVDTDAGNVNRWPDGLADGTQRILYRVLVYSLFTIFTCAAFLIGLYILVTVLFVVQELLS